MDALIKQLYRKSLSDPTAKTQLRQLVTKFLVDETQTELMELYRWAVQETETQKEPDISSQDLYVLGWDNDPTFQDDWHANRTWWSEATNHLNLMDLCDLPSFHGLTCNEQARPQDKEAYRCSLCYATNSVQISAVRLIMARNPNEYPKPEIVPFDEQEHGTQMNEFDMDMHYWDHDWHLH